MLRSVCDKPRCARFLTPVGQVTSDIFIEFGQCSELLDGDRRAGTELSSKLRPALDHCRAGAAHEADPKPNFYGCTIA